jgi:protein-tyrosine phosphatase
MSSFYTNLEAHRAIEAPFQDLYTTPIMPSSKEEKVVEEFDEEFEHIKYSFGTVNINDKFDEKEYMGPTNESNWILKGKFMVGSYPGCINDNKNVESLTKILNCGVTLFACLQQEYNNENREENWRRNFGLRPYFKDVEKMIANKEQYPALTTPVTKVSLIHEKIRDGNITDDNTTLNLAKKLVKAIYNGEVIYLHCWGGHGRAGVIASIMIHLMFNLNALESMSLCKKLHDMRVYNLGVASPQTLIQRLQVKRIISKLHK